MNGLREIKAANRAATEIDVAECYRVQRDRLAQVLRKVLVHPDFETAAEADARKVLVEIFGR